MGTPTESVLRPRSVVVYTGDATNIFIRHRVHHHIFADDMQGTKHAEPSQVSNVFAELESCVSSVFFSLSLPYPSCELLTIQLMTSRGRLNIIKLYKPLTRSTAFYSELHDLLDEIDGLPGRSITCGDFNSPSLSSPELFDHLLADILAGHSMQLSLHAMRE